MNEDNQQPLGEDLNVGDIADPKLLLNQTIAKLQKVITATSSQPRIRSIEMNRIKAEYLKTKYNVEIKLQQ
jgi:hypothetical protein